jgi:hypothetical protein
MNVKSAELFATITLLAGCVVLPVDKPKKVGLCEISSDRKTLKVIDIAKETKSFYSLSGVMLAPITVPTSAVISGTYAAVYNVYKIGETELECKRPN